MEQPEDLAPRHQGHAQQTGPDRFRDVGASAFAAKVGDHVRPAAAEAHALVRREGPCEWCGVTPGPDGSQTAARALGRVQGDGIALEEVRHILRQYPVSLHQCVAAVEARPEPGNELHLLSLSFEIDAALAQLLTGPLELAGERHTGRDVDDRREDQGPIGGLDGSQTDLHRELPALTVPGGDAEPDAHRSALWRCEELAPQLDMAFPERHWNESLYRDAHELGWRPAEDPFDRAIGEHDLASGIDGDDGVRARIEDHPLRGHRSQPWWRRLRLSSHFRATRPASRSWW